MANGAVRVNSERARASRALVQGDTVEVTFPENAPPRVLRPLDIQLTPIHEDDSIIVIDKPPGLVVHPAPGHWDDTLLNALLTRGTQLASGPTGRAGIVHRLDKDTSGLLVIAKTDVAHRRLANALHRRRVEREYAALVWGHVDEVTEIDAPIARHPKDRRRMTVIAGGRPARTIAKQVARFGVCDLVRITLLTGRTHQIRVHLSHVGHPVVGDPVYGAGGYRRVSGAQRPMAAAVEKLAGRQVLHAAVLRFAHPDHGEMCEFRAEWPTDLRPVLAKAAHDDALLARANPLEYLGFFNS